MAKPSSDYNPDPTYIRALIKGRGYTQAQAAAAIGIAPRTMRRYLSLNQEIYREAPRVVIFALERLPTRRRSTRKALRHP